jgi:hypothetical protein
MILFVASRFRYSAKSPQSPEVAALKNGSIPRTYGNHTKSAQSGGLETNGRRDRNLSFSRPVAVLRFVREARGYWASMRTQARGECCSRERWRREWDSNPRYGFPHTRFPSVRLKPLGHPSMRHDVLTPRALFSSGTLDELRQFFPRPKCLPEPYGKFQRIPSKTIATKHKPLRP